MTSRADRLAPVLALVILVAWMFAEGQKGEGVPGVSIAFGLYLVSVALLLIQPDVGQTVLITVAFGAAFWMAGVPMSWVMLLLAVAVAGLSSTYFLFPHVASRIDRFHHQSDWIGAAHLIALRQA